MMETCTELFYSLQMFHLFKNDGRAVSNSRQLVTDDPELDAD